MRKNIVILLLVTQLFGGGTIGQTNVTFVNIGKMYVGAAVPSTRVSLYVPGAMRHTTSATDLSARVECIQNGITELGGNFYQDALTTVFVVDASTKTTSTGKFRFVADHPGVNRTISTQNKSISNFDRGLHYVAFPHLEIATNDSIIIPGKMGIDASSLHQINYKSGKLVLRSEVIAGNAYDASLRVLQAGSSASLVDLGAVIVERDMTLYRPSNFSTQLFGFATPFKNTQLSGYFAGNWVRKILNTGNYGHSAYIYGDKDTEPTDGIIDDNQYVYLAADKLVPSQAYLIKPRPIDYSYSNLQSSSGLWYTGEPNPSLYDKGKYNFNGKVYTVSPYLEQLFADDVLYNNTLNTSNLSSTVNWLIGNSYTCPISTTLLAQAMQNSSLEFSPYIYVYPSGATTYQACDISGNGQSIIVGNVTEIPAMSVFMVRVARNKAQNGSFSIGKELLRHADVAHNNPMTVNGMSKAKTSSKITNQVSFTVSPVGNDKIFDAAAIGFRSDASTGSDNYDMAKAFIADDNVFQLYSLSSTQAKLSANGLPVGTTSVSLAFNPSKHSGDYNLTTEFAESLSTEGLWIIDKKTQQTVNLKEVKSYRFLSQPSDSPDRFTVSFVTPSSTEVIDIKSLKLQLFYSHQKLVIEQLEKTDIGSRVYLYDTQSKLLKSEVIAEYPTFSTNVQGLAPGVYLVKVNGNRSAIAKFFVK